MKSLVLPQPSQLTTNTTGQPEAPKNVSAPPNPVLPPPPAKNDTKPVTVPTPVQPPENATNGLAPQQPAKATTNTTGQPDNGSALAPPKPSVPATDTTTTITSNQATASNNNGQKAYKNPFDDNGDNIVTLTEFMWYFAN